MRPREPGAGWRWRGLLPDWYRWQRTYRDLLDADGGSGVVVLDAEGRVRLWSRGAATLLGAHLPRGAPVARAALQPAAAAIVAPGRPCPAGTAVLAGRVLRYTRRPVTDRGRTVGWVATVTDATEVERLAAQLQAERDATAALRARAHEADNRLHTVVSLVELGHVGQAVDFATAVLARSQQVHDSIHSTVGDPVLAALLTGKAVCADDAGVALHVDPATDLPPTGLPPQDLVLILGNLVDNGIDAAAATPPPRWVHLLARVGDGVLRLEVSDSGPGVPAGSLDAVFAAGWSTKRREEPGAAHGQGLGLALVADAMRRLGGTIEIGRWVGARFTVDIPLPAVDAPGVVG